MAATPNNSTELQHHSTALLQLKAEYIANKRHADNCKRTFTSHLTGRQLGLWACKDIVPKGKAHQWRYKAYMLALADLEPLERRMSFMLIQGGL